MSALLAAHPAAWSEDKPAAVDTRPPPKKLEKIEVQGPNEVDQRRASTAAKIVVNHEELTKYGDTTLLDAVKRLPGITVESDGRGGGSIRMRGLGAGYTQILLDGEPTPPGFSIETLSPDLIERIEVFRSATAEFSTQAIAGTINIVLRKVASHRRRELKVGASISNGQLSTTTNGELSDRIGSLATRCPSPSTRSPSTARRSRSSAAGTRPACRTWTTSPPPPPAAPAATPVSPRN